MRGRRSEELVAYHEAGHAVAVVEMALDLWRVSIQEVGDGWHGETSFGRGSETRSLSIVAWAGPAAEFAYTTGLGCSPAPSDLLEDSMTGSGYLDARKIRASGKHKVSDLCQRFRI